MRWKERELIELDRLVRRVMLYSDAEEILKKENIDLTCSSRQLKEKQVAQHITTLRGRVRHRKFREELDNPRRTMSDSTSWLHTSDLPAKVEAKIFAIQDGVILTRTLGGQCST